MLEARLRLLALICLSPAAFAEAQQTDVLTPNSVIDPARIYEQSREDVTLPIATERSPAPNGETAISIPLANEITPMRCMTAWSFIAGRAIEAPEQMRALHADFSEASAHSHWQHWLSADLIANNGTVSSDFHARRLAAERTFSLTLANVEEPHIYRTLGACYVPPTKRQVGDPTILLRNFMVQHQGLPDSYTVPALQRQLRAFPITESVDVETSDDCDDALSREEDALSTAILSQCFERGGVLASQVKTSAEPIDAVCRISATLQCENIP